MEFNSAGYLHNANLKAVLDYMFKNHLSNVPTLAIGSTSKAKVAVGAVAGVLDGVGFNIAAGEVAFTATTHDIAADADEIQEAIYLIYCDTSAVKILKGTTAGEDLAVCPDLPASHLKIGEVKIKIAAGADIFDATTTELDAAHVTDTYSLKPVSALFA